MKNNRIGRKRKVFRQGKSHISFTGKSVTGIAGAAIISRGIDYYKIREKLRSITSHIDKDCRHKTSTLLEQLIALRFLGGEAVSDTVILNDPAIKAMFDWGNIASPSVFGRRLKRMSWAENLKLENLVTKLSQKVSKTSGKMFITIDSTVDTVFGEKVQGADRGYNPHKPGRNSYHPLIAVDVNSRSVVDGYLRPGSCASNDGLDGFIRKIVAESNRHSKDLIFRLDKGLTSGDAMDTLEELKVGYVAKAKLTSNVMGHISRIKKWRSIGNGHFAANFRCQLTGWKHPRRFCVIERNMESEKASKQMQLFDMLEGRYEVVVTNLHLNPENIWRLYNKGTVVEQVIDEIKNDFAATAIRTNNFWANDTLFLTGLIAYNLLNCIRRIALPRFLKTSRIKRISFLLFSMPANIVKRSRQIKIKIKRDYPFRLIFYQAMNALA